MLNLVAVTLIVLGPNLLGPNVDSNHDTMVTTWYGCRVLNGNTMASGEVFDMDDPTVAAHRDLPFGSKIILRNPDNGRVLIVEIKDRGPWVRGRDLDISKAGARALGFLKQGVARLEVIRKVTP